MQGINAYCKERFNNLQGSIDKKGEYINRHGIEIEVLKTDLLHLTKSLNALSNALWAMVCTIFLSLFSFFIWYVQKL